MKRETSGKEAGRSRPRIPVRARDFFYKNSRPALGSTHPPIQCVPGFFPGGKTVGAWSNLSSSTEVDNEWSYTSTPPVCLHGGDKVNCTFYILPFTSTITSTIRFPMVSLEFFVDILPAALWPLGLTQPLTEMSTRNIFCGVKAAGA